MNKENKQELYASPEVEVMEMNSMQVICQSGTDTPGLTNDYGGFVF